MSENTKPAETITIDQDGEKREIFMSFGLLDEVTTLMGDPAQAASVFFSPALRRAVYHALLQPRSKTGKITKEVDDIFELDIPVDQMEELLGWGVEHALDFFSRSVSRITRMKGSLENHEVFASSQNGSAASASKKPSSGRSK